MKYLFIDGNNLAIRCAFSNSELSNSQGVSTGVQYGFMNSLVTCKNKFPDYQFLVVWDGKSKRRMSESQEGVKKRIVSSAYKENRIKDEYPQPLLDFYEHADFLKKGVGYAGVPQIRYSDYEADDVIASYCKKYSNDDNEIICLTSDKDYFQLLSDKVSIYDGMKQEIITKEKVEDLGISPSQYVDVGALSGDSGDNIHGVPSIGEKTAIKIIKEFGSWENALNKLKEKLQKYRDDFPDLNADEVVELQNITTASGKPKYPEVNEAMPFTGVALAIEKKKIKDKIPKSDIMIVMFGERVKLAYSLKKMDDDIENLPDICAEKSDMDKLSKFLDYYEIKSLDDSVHVFQNA